MTMPYNPERLPKQAQDYEFDSFNGRQNCEKAMLFMLDQPEFSFQHPDVLNQFRQKLHMLEAPTNEWLEITTPLFRKHQLLTLSKSTPNLVKPDILTLSVERISEDPEMPFITQRVLDAKQQIHNQLQQESSIQPPDFESGMSVTALRKVVNQANSSHDTRLDAVA